MSNTIEIFKIEQNELIICFGLLYESEISTKYSDRRIFLYERETRLSQLQNKLLGLGLVNGSDYILISRCGDEFAMRDIFGNDRRTDPTPHGRGRHECFDYLHQNNYAFIKATGPLNILKVLYSIPVEQLVKSDSYRERYCATRTAYASQLSSDYFVPSVYKFFHRMDTELMLELQNKLLSVHQSFSRLPSTTIAQLIADFSYINQLESEEIFKPSKRELAIASLHQAIMTEKKSPTLIASYVFFKGESVLNPHYMRIFNMFLIKFNLSYEPNKLMAIYLNMRTRDAGQQPPQTDASL